MSVLWPDASNTHCFAGALQGGVPVVRRLNVSALALCSGYECKTLPGTQKHHVYLRALRVPNTPDQKRERSPADGKHDYAPAFCIWMLDCRNYFKLQNSLSRLFINLRCCIHNPGIGPESPTSCHAAQYLKSSHSVLGGSLRNTCCTASRASILPLPCLRSV